MNNSNYRMSLSDRKHLSYKIRRFLDNKKNASEILTLCHFQTNEVLFENEELRIWKAIFNALAVRRSSKNLDALLNEVDVARRSIENPEDFTPRDLGRPLTNILGNFDS